MDNINSCGRECNKESKICQTAERKDTAETKMFGEPPQTSELGDTRKHSAYKQNKKSTLNILKALQAFVVGGIALVAIGTATLFPTNEQPSASIGEVTAFDTYAEYSVDVAATAEQELTLVIFNDYFKSESTVSAGETAGVIDGLTPNKSDTIAVKGNSGFGEKTLSEKTFRTLATERIPHARLDGIEMACNCGVDGMFKFKIRYEDVNNYWSEFSAVLETIDGGTQVDLCGFSSDQSGWQYFK